MAFSKNTVILVILCFILIQVLENYGGNQHMVAAEQIGKIGSYNLHTDSVGIETGHYCAGKCNYRCSKASRQKMCLRACNSCCQRCNCVPPGTAGNRDECSCYASLTTHGGKLKCP
ncbi:gibberellin-regulated protein 2-like [Abrus precatorius]|uniref:Gibberellin-regulated protein 2-like n=1 Tax=Abrus precatorius TaxID=3816 RepID=A0A8B8M828_ABRPR|nr:gibberellin-regulated protein 2-like [Abrus precatorius]